MKLMGRENNTKVRVCYETCDYDGCNGGALNMASAQQKAAGFIQSHFIIGIAVFLVWTIITGIS